MAATRVRARIAASLPSILGTKFMMCLAWPPAKYRCLRSRPAPPRDNTGSEPMRNVPPECGPCRSAGCSASFLVRAYDLGFGSLDHHAQQILDAQRLGDRREADVWNQDQQHEDQRRGNLIGRGATQTEESLRERVPVDR